MLKNIWLILVTVFTKPFQESVIYKGKIYEAVDFYNSHFVFQRKVYKYQ
jgi:hypothetical protein